MPPNPIKAAIGYLRGDDLKPTSKQSLQVAQESKLMFLEGTNAALTATMLVHGPGATEIANGIYSQDGNSAVYACLMAICTAYPEAPMRVYRAGSDPGKRDMLSESPFQSILDEPNPSMGAEELWFWIQWAKHCDGNAYLRKVRAGNAETGNVVQLWPVSPRLIEPKTIKGSGEFISYYRYHYDAGHHEDISPDNIVHFRLGINDADMRLGLSPLKRLVAEVSTDEEATRFTDALLGNYGVPGLVVTTAADVPMDASKAMALKESVGASFSNNNRGKVAVIVNGAKVDQFGFDPQQMNLEVVHRLPEERISAVLRVPAIVAGLGAGLSRACVPSYARVQTPTGTKTIAELQAGSIVWSFKDGAIVPRMVSHKWRAERDMVYEIRTANRRVRATGNHPFMVRVPGRMGGGANNTRQPSYEWRNLEHLKVGDYIIQAKGYPDQGVTTLPDGRAATVEALKFFGAIIGDGTVAPGVGVRIAMPPSDRCVSAYRELASGLFQKYSSGGERMKRATDGKTAQIIGMVEDGASYHAIGRELDMNNATVRSRYISATVIKPIITAPIFIQERERDFGFSSAEGSRWLATLGLAGRAHTKRVPTWVYGLSRELRLAFLAGVVDTDGYVDKRGALALWLCNKDLVNDVRDLMIGLGIRCCNVGHRVMSPDVLPQAGTKESYEAWGFTASSAVAVAEIPFSDPLYRERVEANQQRHRREGFDSRKAGLSDDCGFTKIQEIIAIGEDDVYDLTVEDGHSFFCENILVSNTYANFSEARAMFTESTILPMYRVDQRVVNQHLRPDFTSDKRIYAAFDITDIRALQEDEDAKYARLNLGVLGKWIKPDEARADVGLPPLPNGEGDSISGPATAPAVPAAAKSLDILAEIKAGGSFDRYPELMAAMVELAQPGFEADLEEYFSKQRLRLKRKVIGAG